MPIPLWQPITNENYAKESLQTHERAIAQLHRLTMAMGEGDQIFLRGGRFMEATIEELKRAEVYPSAQRISLHQPGDHRE